MSEIGLECNCLSPSCYCESIDVVKPCRWCRDGFHKMNMEIKQIREYRKKHPWNSTIRTSKNGKPCIVCGTYLHSSRIFCPHDSKCIRLAKKLDICLETDDPKSQNSRFGRNITGKHDYKRIDFPEQKNIIKQCIKCKKTIKEKKPKHEQLESFFKNSRTNRTALGKLRHLVLKRDRYKCCDCGATKEEIKLEIDHIIPFSKGGLTELDNLQTLCKKCNRSKHTRTWRGGE